ncbi:ABC transporter substrate-binding protein [Variovorax soli]|uniref:ABC transporter substrate-binding protein n=1 Tax=Variovorax soli TaxID=376815 RepID=UPI000838BB01|nr:ABC transporter substrate-binding protein [Variovorax soli]
MIRRRTLVQGVASLWALRAGAQPASRKVTDMAGREVELPPRIQRVVTLGSLPVLNSFVFTMGESRSIVNGLADFAKPHWKYQTVFAPQLAGQPTMQLPNREPHIEAILQAQPDVVLTLHRDAVDRLAALGLRVVYLAWREPEDVKGCMALMGRVFGKPDVAQAYQQWFEGSLATVRGGLQGLAESQRPRVLYLQPDTLTQPRLIAEWWIPAAGGISVTQDGRRSESRSFSLEQVLAWDPDVMILTTPQAVGLVRSERAFAGLRAVRQGRLHVAPVGAHTWSNRTAEQPLTVMWAAKTFHPQRFAGLDLASQTRDFYAKFFGTRLSDAQVAEILSGEL